MLGFNFNLLDQLTFYGAYHSNPINQLIHFIFVPLILWSVAVWLAYTPSAVAPAVVGGFAARLGLPAAMASFAEHYLVFNGAFFLLAVYALYYLTLEPFAGASWTLCTALPLWASATGFRQAVTGAWTWALGAHLLGWFMQIYFGHSMAEKRRPALLDSFFQSLVLAPLFVWFELLFVLGYRPALRDEVQRRAQANIAAWRAQTAPLLEEQQHRDEKKRRQPEARKE
jgi:2-hydroxy fatty acid dioxygenase